MRRGVFLSVPTLIAAIEEYIKLNNQNLKPFVSTKKVAKIIEKINHCKSTVETLH